MGLQTWALRKLAGSASTPETGEKAGHGSGMVSSAYFGDTKARIGTYSPDKVSFTTMRKMERDPTIAACLKLNELALRSVQWDCEGPDAVVAEFVKTAVQGVWPSLVRSCAHGVAEGCAPNEKVWERRDLSVEGEGGAEDVQDVTGWVPSKIKDIDPASLQSIDVDGLGEFAGYHLTEPPSGMLDADKAFHFASDLRYGNWWGTPRLAAAYDPWYGRALLQALYLRFMEKRVVEAVHVEFPTGETDGTPNSEIAATIAKGFQSNDTAIWTPAALADMESWAISLIGDGTQRSNVAAAFLSGMAMFDRRMLYALLTPEKVLNGDAGAYALSETHKDIWLMCVEGTANDIAECVNTQLVPQITRYTFGDVPVPRLVIAGLTEESKALLAKVFEIAVQSGAASVDFDSVAERLGIPVGGGESAGATQETTAPESGDGTPTADEALSELRRNAALLNEAVQASRVELAAKHV
jgi:hypothetical protein